MIKHASSGRKASLRRTRVFCDVISYLILALACLWVILPFTVILSTALKTYQDSVRIPFDFFPGYVDFSSFGAVFGLKSVWTGLGNTLIVVVPIMLIGVFTSALAAYAFAKIRFPRKGAMFAILLLSMMIPGVVTMTPAYVIYDAIYWTDTFLPLMIPNAFGTAACVFYLRQFFHGIPDDLLEAAELDGLGRFGVFVRILLPLSMPALIAQMVLWFIAGYNDYFGPMLYLDSESKFTLQIVLHQMAGSAESNWPKIMACCLVTMIPILVLYFAAQRFFIEGIVMTGLKE